MPEAPELEYAGFWTRVWASLIDTVLILAIIVPMLLAVYGTAYFEPSGSVFRGPLDFALNWVFPAVAIILFWIYRSATPGKMVFGARIVDAGSGGQPSRGQLVGRYLAYLVSTLPLCLGLLWVGIDRRKQGFHDKLAGTVVVRERRSGRKPPVRFDRNG